MRSTDRRIQVPLASLVFGDEILWKATPYYLKDQSRPWVSPGLESVVKGGADSVNGARELVLLRLESVTQVNTFVSAVVMSTDLLTLLVPAPMNVGES